MAVGVLCILGALSIAYGVTVMLAWSGTPFFAVWYVLGVVLLLAAWGVHAGVFAGLPVLAKRVGVGVLVVLALGLAVLEGLVLKGFGAKGEPDLDYLVVLGAQVREDGPSRVLQYRLDTAVEYLAANERTQCVVTGGKGAGEPRAEAHVMAEYLEQHGVSAGRITVEDASLSTAENFANTLRLVDVADARVGVVTNDFHIYRSVRIAQRKGMHNACGIAAGSNPGFLPNNMLREALCIVKDTATGNM